MWLKRQPLQIWIFNLFPFTLVWPVLTFALRYLRITIWLTLVYDFNIVMNIKTYFVPAVSSSSAWNARESLRCMTEQKLRRIFARDTRPKLARYAFEETIVLRKLHRFLDISLVLVWNHFYQNFSFVGLCDSRNQCRNVIQTNYISYVRNALIWKETGRVSGSSNLLNSYRHQ